MICPTCGYEFDPAEGLECPRCGERRSCSEVSCGECDACSGLFERVRHTVTDRLSRDGEDGETPAPGERSE